MSEFDDLEYRPGDDFDSYHARSGALFQKLLDADRAVDLSKTLVGCLWSTPVADGQAWYIVTKDNPLTLRHLPIGDGYTAPAYALRGLRRDDIITGAKFRRFWDELVKENQK